MNVQLLRYAVGTLFSLIVGVSFGGEPVLIAVGKAELPPKQPQVAVTRNGTVHLSYGVGNSIFHCRSTDQGSSFNTPREAFRVPNLSLGMRRGPRIAVTENALVVTAIGGKQGKGRDGDLLAWRSTDNGETWLGPVNVNDTADSAREGLHGMAAGPDSSIYCVWLDLREKRTEVFLSKSVDGGETWMPNVRVYRSPDGNVCECCHPSIVIGGEKVHVMFRNSLAGNRDMYLATSNDSGATFGFAEKIGSGTWKLNACPMDGGMLAMTSKGALESVWRRDGEIFTASSVNAQERSLGRGAQPWMASSKDGPVIVWTTGREGDLLVQKPGSKQPEKISGTARDPMVASGINGGNMVVACWESKQNGQSEVFAVRVDVEHSASP